MNIQIGMKQAMRCRRVNSLPSFFTPQCRSQSSSTTIPLPWSVDVHSHMYLPRYMSHLRSRKTVPRVTTVDNRDRLMVLPSEENDESTAIGRPIGPEYFDMHTKLEFMDSHRISHSVVSLANPWLDHLTADENAEQASQLASQLNDDLQGLFEESDGRILGMAVLPTQLGSQACVKEARRVHAELPGLRGVILGCGGIKKTGLDCESEMLELYECLSECGLPLLIHPHFGVGNEQEYGGYGHSLYLALGFPFETTAAVSRLLLSGILLKVPHLRLVLAHAAGAIPMLLGRLQSCGLREDMVRDRLLGHTPIELFAQHCFLDSITYDCSSLRCALNAVGEQRLLFGSDHPFFPPTERDQSDPQFDGRWPSCVANQVVAQEIGVSENDPSLTVRILNENARSLFQIQDLKYY